ncbi:MAG: ABC transporter permease [Roseicyclus sp.]
MAKLLSLKALLGFALVLLVIAVAFLAPVFIPPERATQMVMSARLQPPSLDFILGTDQLGRDLFARVMLGAQTSLTIAVSAVTISIVLGLPLGLVSGYFGGRIDNVLMRIIDALLSFPALLLALTISAVLGPNMQNTIIAIGIAFTPFLARIVRGEALRVSQLPYVEAARAAGTRDGAMILRHILPNIMPALIVQATISLAFAVLAEAALSFLGLGTQPPQASWGLMIQASRQFLDIAPWTALVPGAALAITILGLNLLGDVLRDVLDPRVR